MTTQNRTAPKRKNTLFLTSLLLISLTASFGCEQPRNDEPETIEVPEESVGRYNCCPEWSDAELEENDANDVYYECKASGCSAEVMNREQSTEGGPVTLSCETHETPEGEEIVYNLIRCEPCVCANGCSIISGWPLGQPDPLFRGYCSGGAVKVNGGEISCGIPFCQNRCASLGWDDPSAPCD